VVHGAAKGQDKSRIFCTNLLILPTKIAHSRGCAIATQQQDGDQNTQYDHYTQSGTINGLEEFFGDYSLSGHNGRPDSQDAHKFLG
jgi:hypothetical protein